MTNDHMIPYQWAENIRKRPAMFIGSLHFTGICNLLEYLFEELVETGLEGLTLTYTFWPDEICIHIVNADTQQFTRKMNQLSEPGSTDCLGLGTVLSLSSKIEVRAIAGLSLVVLWGERGKYLLAATTAQKREQEITLTFSLDKEIFPNTQLNYGHITAFLRKLAYLNPGIKIISETAAEMYQCNVFHFKEGVAAQLEHLLSQKEYAYPIAKLNICETIDGCTYQISCCYADWSRMDFYIESYANNQETYWGGSLVEGVLAGMIAAFEKLATDNSVIIDVTRDNITPGLALLAAVRGKDFNYTGSVRYQLDMPAIEVAVRQFVFDQLYRHLLANPADARSILARFRREDATSD